MCIYICIYIYIYIYIYYNKKINVQYTKYNNYKVQI